MDADEYLFPSWGGNGIKRHIPVAGADLTKPHARTLCGRMHLTRPWAVKQWGSADRLDLATSDVCARCASKAAREVPS
jgi:hypothetical protein